MMVPRSTDIPHNIERTALQKLLAVGSASALSLRPAGKRTLAKMAEKGWIKLEGHLYTITAKGEAAFRAKIPERSE